MFQLQSSNHQAAYVRSIRGNLIAAAYIRLKIISGRRYLSLTYSGIGFLQVKMCSQYKR